MIKFIGVAFILAQFCFQMEQTTFEPQLRAEKGLEYDLCQNQKAFELWKGEIVFETPLTKGPKVIIHNCKSLNDERKVVITSIKRIEGLTRTEFTGQG